MESKASVRETQTRSASLLLFPERWGKTMECAGRERSERWGRVTWKWESERWKDNGEGEGERRDRDESRGSGVIKIIMYNWRSISSVGSLLLLPLLFKGLLMLAPESFVAGQKRKKRACIVVILAGVLCVCACLCVGVYKNPPYRLHKRNFAEFSALTVAQAWANDGRGTQCTLATPHLKLNLFFCI